jgi:hypothetical protein
MCVQRPQETTGTLRVDDLNTAEILVLWSFRVWVRCNSEQTALQQILKEGFEIANVPEAYLKFDEMMSYTQSLLTASVEVRRIKCRSVNRDEITLLSAIAELQINETSFFAAAMSRWIPVEYIEEIIPASSAFATLMANQDLILRRWKMVEKKRSASLLESTILQNSMCH